jgi:hypothetical protein
VLLGYITVYLLAAGVAAFPAIGLMVLSFATGILFGVATAFYIIKVAPLIVSVVNLNGINLPSMTYPDCEACSCESSSLALEEIYGDGTEGNLTVIKIADNEIYTRKNSSFLCDVNSNTFWGNTPNNDACIDSGDNEDCNDSAPFCRMRIDRYSGNGNRQRQKYELNSYGIRYAIAGYPNTKIKGTPTNRLFYSTAGGSSTDQEVIFLEDVTYSHRLNLANIRQRYFDNNYLQNIITTTVDNDGYPSDPFTDNMVVLLCDNNTLESLTPGSLISFTNPDNTNDLNINGYNVSGVTENQFGTNAITGTSLINTTVTVNYIDATANDATANLTITGTSTEREYKFKGGIEYFQVITGMTAEQGANYSFSPSNSINFLKFFFFDARQKVYYRSNCNPNPTESSLIDPLKQIGDGWKNLNAIFLVRGVDPFTEKQVIKYDLSKLFGKAPLTHVVRGKYYLNVPIQNNSGNLSSDWWINKKTPESHEVGYQFSKLYHKPFNFRPDPNLYSAFTTNTIKYYSALDKKSISYNGYEAFPNDFYTLAQSQSNPPLRALAINDNTQSFWYDTGLSDYHYDTENRYRLPFILPNGTYTQTVQGNVEGGSFLYTNFPDMDDKYNFNYQVPNSNPIIIIPQLDDYLDGNIVPGFLNDNSDRRPRLFAPAYHENNPTLSETMLFDQNVDNVRMIIRSDRLPTSDTTQVIGNNGYALYQNDNFTIYRISDNGETLQLGGQQTDYTGNSDDYSEDAISGTTSVLATFSCEGMVPLPCYSGSGDNFGVKSPCPENENPTRISKGCYKLIQEPYLTEGAILRDYNNFFEWKSRFRLLFGACRGVISQVFQNNWVNGTLYSYAFKKKTIFDAQNNPKKYVFCGSKDFDLVPGRQNQGPIYLDDQTNTFYYRSTPYVLQQNGTNVNGYFIGQRPQLYGTNIKNIYGKGSNERNLHFPTTMMDLGPRDQFAKEICLNPQLENYLVETVQSTSFNDTSDLLLLFIVSRLVNTGFWELALSRGDASINQLFSRSDDRIDGDVAQLFSINSEYGIIPFNEQFYGNDDIVLGTPNEIFYGVLFSAITQNRVALTPGIATFGNVQQLVGYPKTQVVPMYNWEIRNDQGQATINTSTIFGTEKNDWLTDFPNLGTLPPMYSAPYQNMSFTGSDYFKATNGPSTGYILNYNNLGERDYFWQNNSNQDKANFVVGAPYHFYFGLGKGKTALNRFITKYIIGTT